MAYRSGRHAEAEELLQGLVDRGSNEPLHLSLLGLLKVLQGTDEDAGLALCQRAAIVGVFQPELYLNLARAHARLGQSARAVRVLRKGLRVGASHPALENELQRLSPRRSPVVPALSRDSFLNKYLGRARVRLIG